MMNEEALRKEIDTMLDKAEKVDYSIKLPDTEYDVMEALWESEIPVTTAKLMQSIGVERGWKTPTLISFLARLEERGFVYSIKNGKERCYFPLAQKNKYIDQVTRRFLQQYHNNSFVHFLAVLFPDRKMPDEEIDAMLEWLENDKEI